MPKPTATTAILKESQVLPLCYASKRQFLGELVRFRETEVDRDLLDHVVARTISTYENSVLYNVALLT